MADPESDQALSGLLRRSVGLSPDLPGRKALEVVCQCLVQPLIRRDHGPELAHPVSQGGPGAQSHSPVGVLRYDDKLADPPGCGAALPQCRLGVGVLY